MGLGNIFFCSFAILELDLIKVINRKVLDKGRERGGGGVNGLSQSQDLS